LREWLHAVAFADKGRGYAVGEQGIILRTDDGGKTWKDLESSVRTNLFAVSVLSRDDVLIAGDMGRVLASRDGGLTWETQPTITSSPLFAVVYRGGANAWVAGRGGAILRRTVALGTVKISVPKFQPVCVAAPEIETRRKQPATQPGGRRRHSKAVPPVRKPVKP